MVGLDQKTAARVGELAASPLEQNVAVEMHSLICRALRSSRVSPGGTKTRSRRTRKDRD